MDTTKETDYGFPLRELHLFAGAGGGILGGLLCGHVPVCAVELEAYPRNILLQRQRDGHLPWFPVWDDVCTFDGKPWRGKVDIVCGGFPCQDISSAGKGAGLSGSRSGLWREMSRIIGEVRPAFAFIENSPRLVSRGLDVVLADLASMGYDAVWGVLGSDDVGACHHRKRMWILAYANLHGEFVKLGNDMARKELARVGDSGLSGDTTSAGLEGKNTVGQNRCATLEKGKNQNTAAPVIRDLSRTTWQNVESRLDRVVDGVADRMDRSKAIGNGQDPRVVRLAWFTLLELAEKSVDF